VPGKSSKVRMQVSVPQTDTGGLGEKPKMNGRAFVKELGKKARRKFAICLAIRKGGRSESIPTDCLPKTQLSANP
jgi:hypothetical protein